MILYKPGLYSCVTRWILIKPQNKASLYCIRFRGNIYSEAMIVGKQITAIKEIFVKREYK